MNEDTTAPAPAEPIEPQDGAEHQTAPAPSQEPDAPENQEPAKQEPDEIDLDGFTRERYVAPAPVQAPSQASADDLAKELASLPADENGVVSPETAAKWFADKLASNRASLEAQIAPVAQKAAMSILTETSQQQELLKKYPEINKDRGMLEMVFDLRDAAALRGQSLTLAQAAEKLAKQRQEGRSEGEDSVRRRTTIQAATHLETSSTRGANQSQSRRELAQKAFHGKGTEAREARRQFMTGFIQREIEAGRIQLS